MHRSEKKYLLANEAPFMTKELQNTIIKRSRLRNKFLRNKSLTNRKSCKIQRNLWKKLLRKNKKSCLSVLDTNTFTDNRTFW